MATNIWRGTTTAVAQVDTATPANVEVTDIFTLTITDDNGNTASAAFTATAAAVANVTAGLTAAWNASTDPLLEAITATDDTTHVTLTADTAGVPFALTATAVDGGGADDQTLTVATTTDNKGPYDWNVPENWTLQAVPVNTNAIIIPPGSPSIFYGMGQIAVTIAGLDVQKGYTGNIGRISNGHLYYLHIGSSDAIAIRGNGSLIAFHLEATSQEAVLVDHTGTPSATGRQTVYLHGLQLNGVTILNGTVGMGTYEGEAVTLTDDLVVTGGSVYCGENWDNTGTEIHNYGGTLTICGMNSPLYQYAGTTRVEAAIGGSAWYIYNGALHLNATGTYAIVELHGGATLYNTEALTSPTITACTCYAGATISDPSGNIIWTNDIEFPNGIAGCALDFGSAIEFQPNPI